MSFLSQTFTIQIDNVSGTLLVQLLHVLPRDAQIDIVPSGSQSDEAGCASSYVRSTTAPAEAGEEDSISWNLSNTPASASAPIWPTLSEQSLKYAHT
jgi:hypothetical protein